MSKHTPGPWIWSGGKDGDMTISHGLIREWGGPDGTQYADYEKCVVGGCGCCNSPFGVEDQQEMEANAHLISSAPELLEALEAMLLQFSDACIIPEDDSACMLARKAISKAKGSDHER